MKIGVFCSANSNISHSFFSATEEFGRWIGKSGHSLVWGGCSLGLMDTIGRSFIEGRNILKKERGFSPSGSQIGAAAVSGATQKEGLLIGIVPEIIEEKGKVFSPLDVLVGCRNLSDRKDIIIEKSDILIALPGGIGTLDEIFTAASSSTIGYHKKKTILYNIDGFWTPLILLMDHLEKEGMTRGTYRDKIIEAKSLDDIKKYI